MVSPSSLPAFGSNPLAFTNTLTPLPVQGSTIAADPVELDTAIDKLFANGGPFSNANSVSGATPSPSTAVPDVSQGTPQGFDPSTGIGGFLRGLTEGNPTFQDPNEQGGSGGGQGGANDPAGKSILSGAGDAIATFFVRGAVIILGLIFVAVGLFMFKGPSTIVQQAERVTR